MSEPRPDLIPFQPVSEEAGDATQFTCALCGTRFTHATLVCASCPLNSGCEVVKCPSCGYQFPRRSRLVDLAKRLFGAADRAGATGPRPVTALRAGEAGIIARVASRTPERLVKLSGLGVMPGARVTLVQRQPAVVLRIAETTIALDRDVADEILIEPPRGESGL
jgi:DtxR family Mn-dependent transcriptional regulator/ferrous iron transport protein A